jgi:hypothetical protein
MVYLTMLSIAHNLRQMIAWSLNDELERMWKEWSEFLATDPEDPGSIPGATRFSEK